MKQLYENISGVVMAGGKSSRMGTDKGLLDFNGKALVQYGLDLLNGCFTDIYIGTNHADYEQFEIPIIPDIYKNCGPMGGLHAILNSINTDFAFIISCDMPFLNLAILNKILNNCNNFHITIPRVGDHLEPLCAVYSKLLLPEIEKRIKAGNYKMHDFIMNVETNYIEFENNKQFLNINTKEDLERIN